eukprot:27574-Eustigmatos_ZCMA.PRE.1
MQVPVGALCHEGPDDDSQSHARWKAGHASREGLIEDLVLLVVELGVLAEVESLRRTRLQE